MTTLIALLIPPVVHVKPPRALFVPFPFGYALGRANDPPFQQRILDAALELVTDDEVPVLAEFSAVSGRSARILQEADVDTRNRPSPEMAANEVTALRAWYERWVREHDGRTGVGASGVSQRRFRPVIRFLESFARGEEADSRDRPADVPPGRFIRFVVDDLKAFAYEARMAQRPEDDEEALHRWFWGETGIAALVRAVADRMATSDDEDTRNQVRGLVR